MHRITLLFVITAFFQADSNAATIIGGINRDEFQLASQPRPTVQAEATEGSRSINFDNITAPPVFIQTSALLSIGGVRFEGSSTQPLDGGAVLNSEGGFLTSGFSPPNFLAFNCSAALSNGGKAKLPEIITFPTVVRGVSLSVGSGIQVGHELKMFGIGPNGVEGKPVVLTASMKRVIFSKPLQRIMIWTDSASACIFIIDDITWLD